MITVEKVTEKDFESIYPLLQKFHNRKITKEDWKKLFIKQWQIEEDNCGMMLKDGSTAVGYIGLIFHKRNIHGKEIRFCNMTSWIVDENYREKSHLLFYPILRLENYILLNLSPSLNVSEMLKKLKFEVLENNFILFFPVPQFHHLFKKSGSRIKIITNNKKIEEILNEDDLKIYKEHSLMKCRHLLITQKDKYCYLVVNKTFRRKLPFIFINYISHPDIFYDNFNKIRVLLPLRMKVLGILMDERFLGERKVGLYIKKPRKKYFKSTYSDFNEKIEIDNLYSELVMLGI